MSDTITVLRCANRKRLATKTLLPGRDPKLKESWLSYARVFQVDAETRTLTGPGSLLALLRELERDLFAFAAG
jgi:hypothetical protein